jgi:hypothetical protein
MRSLQLLLQRRALRHTPAHAHGRRRRTHTHTAGVHSHAPTWCGKPWSRHTHPACWRPTACPPPCAAACGACAWRAHTHAPRSRCVRRRGCEWCRGRQQRRLPPCSAQGQPPLRPAPHTHTRNPLPRASPLCETRQQRPWPPRARCNSKQLRARTHTHTHTHTRTHTHTHTHTQPHTRTHARTHTHTHTRARAHLSECTPMAA